jgi:hypothetical protein
MFSVPLGLVLCSLLSFILKYLGESDFFGVIQKKGVKNTHTQTEGCGKKSTYMRKVEQKLLTVSTLPLSRAKSAIVFVQIR